MADSEEIEQHRKNVSRMSRPGQSLARDSMNVTVRNADWFTEVAPGKWEATELRERLHRRLLEHYRQNAPNARKEFKAVVLAGAPGAGKSTLLKEVLGVELEHYLVIDADDFKESLLVEAQQDGTYESVIKPAEVKDLEAQDEEFFPLDLATLVHEESSMLAAELRAQCLAEGTNVVIDKVLASNAKAQKLGEQLADAGYSIEIVEVDVPLEVSKKRTTQRWEEDYEAALENDDELGARWVPYEFTDGVFDGPQDQSKPAAVAEKLARECPVVMRFRVYRTTVAATSGTSKFGALQKDLRRLEHGSELLEADQLNEVEGGA